MAFYRLSLTGRNQPLCRGSVTSMLRKEPHDPDDSMIHVRELTPADAPAIGRIEARSHTRELADGAEGHRRYLSQALAEGVNLSFGAVRGQPPGWLPALLWLRAHRLSG